MKTLILTSLVIGLTTLNSCNQKIDVNTILENSEKRTELFDAIANNHSYMTQFMDNMHGNDHAMQMMQGNKKMMGTMMQGNSMQMMMKDSMMQYMMKDGKMMGNMMQMMHEKGMMSEDCMESCKKMMGDKGMDMKGMGMMDGSKKMESSEEDHSEHH